MDNVINRYGAFILLQICVPEHLKEMYEEYVNAYNGLLLSSIDNPHVFVNDGFDLYVPETIICEKLTKIDFGVKIQSTYISESRRYPCGVKMYARSSIYKTPLRLANAVGVIDPGYRGNIIGMFDASEGVVEKHSRVVQLCGDAPFFVEIINENQLTSSNRGANGFGSSG
jgi:dUTP pyrophosphatase